LFLLENEGILDRTLGNQNDGNRKIYNNDSESPNIGIYEKLASQGLALRVWIGIITCEYTLPTLPMKMTYVMLK